MNKRIILLFLLIGLFHRYGISQHSITPGVGFDEIQMEMEISELIKIIGQPTSVRSRKQEKKRWKRNGYKTKRTFTFDLKFDSVYVFEKENKYAIWKAFVKDDRAILYNLSSYIFDTLITQEINVLDSVGFYDSVSRLSEIIGSDYYTKVDKNQNVEYIYFEKGIRFVANDSLLRNIYLFKPKIARRGLLKKLRLHRSEPKYIE